MLGLCEFLACAAATSHAPIPVLKLPKLACISTLTFTSFAEFWVLYSRVACADMSPLQVKLYSTASGAVESTHNIPHPGAQCTIAELQQQVL